MTIETLLARIRALPAALRLGGAVAVVLLSIAAIVAGVATHVPRVPLFATALHPEQLAEVEAELAATNVPFTPTSDNVVVDAAKRNEVLLKLSLAGVPHAHVETTTEALAGVGVLTPQTVIDAQARSGLAGDIEAALRSVDGIDDARVIIAPAKPAEFGDDVAGDASASVRIRLRAGAQLRRAQISGIRRFVAASVPGLDPAHVTMLDDRGIALDDAGSVTDGDALEHALQSALDTALGAGVAVVRVHAEYGDTATERHDVRRVPVSSIPLQRSAASEHYSGSGRSYEKQDEHDDNGSDTQETVTRSDRGALARISTAVFIDGAVAADLVSVRELAAATVGFDARRGDTLVVRAVNFHRVLQPKRDGWFLLYSAAVLLLPTVALIVAAFVALRSALPAIAPILNELLLRRTVDRTSQAVKGYAPSHVRGALAHEPPHAAAAIISALPAATAAAVLELYPPHEREAIVRRMQRANTPLIPDAQEILGRHV